MKVDDYELIIVYSHFYLSRIEASLVFYSNYSKQPTTFTLFPKIYEVKGVPFLIE